MKITLSPRLRCVAGYVEPGARVVDVGTDHAYIPLWLLQNRLCEHAWATDNKPGPLRNAARDAEAAGLRDRLTLYLCDGLSACAPEDIDTVIVAGMGGETMQGILAAAPWALERRLILQPQTKRALLRRWLGERGLGVADASLVHDTGRIYLVWRVAPGAPADAGPVDAPLLEKRDPLLKAFTQEQIKRRRTRLHGLERARSADAGAIEALRGELARLEEIYKEAASWQQ